MREIKFRGKRKDDNKLIYGNLAYMFGVVPCIMFKNRFSSSEFDGVEIGDNEVMLGGFVQVIPETLGQFTGFYDKNGNEIYEGDILKPLNEHFTYVVKFGNGCFYIEYILGKWNTLERGIEVYKNFDRDIEIIGNIHENPELLENETI